jgi:hypothetical protein
LKKLLFLSESFFLVTICLFGEVQEMTLLVSNQNSNQLFIAQIYNNSIIKNQKILELNLQNGEMIIKSNFLDNNTLYVWYKRNAGNGLKETILSSYNITLQTWNKIFSYIDNWDEIKTIDTDLAKCFYSYRTKNNIIFVTDLNTQKEEFFISFSPNEQINNIEIIPSQNLICINTISNSTKHYYLINIINNEIIENGIGNLYANKRNIHKTIVSKDDKIYLFNGTYNEINVSEKKGLNMFNAFSINEDVYIFCFDLKASNFFENFLFGPGHFNRKFYYAYMDFSKEDIVINKMDDKYFEDKILLDGFIY